MSKIKAVQKISFLWVGSLIGAGCAFFTQVILARMLGPQAFGAFSSVLSLMSLLVPFVGFGIAQYWLKEFGKDGWNAARFVKPSLKLVLINIVLVMSILAAWAVGGPNDHVMQAVLFIMSVFVVGQVAVELISGKLQLEERYGMLALWQLMPHVARFILVAIVGICFGNHFDIKMAAVLFACVSLVVLALAINPLIIMAKGKFSLKGHGLQGAKNRLVQCPKVKETLQGSWPFGLAAVFQLIYFQSDIVLVKYITGDDAAGYYNVAFTVMAAVLLFPGIIYQKFLLPKMHRWANYNRELFYKVYSHGNVVMLLLGMLAMILAWMLSPVTIPYLFGNGYEKAVDILMILVLSAPILFVANSVGATLVTQEHMKIKVKLMGGVALLNVVLNLVLIPVYGAFGAAVATVVSNLVLLISYYVSAQLWVFGATNEAK
ncbi:oligosaccharide flippase family protein [Stutzerimonas frequens]|uniref:oligosaccharide flippase family protein n=1 Tax=Stutzerimonas frequens TaxID=2968969 RepID=UPI001AAFCE07|nr:oligosaccharide flippase family protein [Stutzerimonas frequens]QTF55351.1 oligosaccharide flippase family protein [Stutzerimonas frequens]